nr:GNAT family N-acetyltransferase [Caballeronia calidae]
MSLRRVVSSDCEYVQAIAGDDEGLAGLACPPLATVDWWRGRIDRHANNGLFVIAETEDLPIAFLEIHVDITDWSRRNVGSCMLCVREDMRGQGIGRALLEQGITWAQQSLGLMRLELHVWADNWRAINLYQSLGFLQEGTHPAFGFREGAYVTAISMGKVFSSVEKIQ